MLLPQSLLKQLLDVAAAVRVRCSWSALIRSLIGKHLPIGHMFSREFARSLDQVRSSYEFHAANPSVEVHATLRAIRTVKYQTIAATHMTCHRTLPQPSSQRTYWVNPAGEPVCPGPNWGFSAARSKTSCRPTFSWIHETWWLLATELDLGLHKLVNRVY